jgi:hypothetical protein
MAVSGLQALYEGVKRMAESDTLMVEFHKLKAPGTNYDKFKQDYQDQVQNLKSDDHAKAFELLQDFRSALMSISKENETNFVKAGQMHAGIQNVSILRQFFANPDEMFTKPGGLGGPTKEQKEALKKAVGTKSDELTELQKVQQSLIQTLGIIGGHILKVLIALVRIFSDIGATLLALPDMIANKDGARDRILNALSERMTTSGSVISEAFKGIGEEWDRMDDRPGSLKGVVDPFKIWDQGEDYDPAAIIRKNMPEESAESRREKATSASMQVADVVATFLQKEDELEKKVFNWIADGIDKRLKAFFGDTTKEAVESLGYRPAKGAGASVGGIMTGAQNNASAEFAKKSTIPFPHQQ